MPAQTPLQYAEIKDRYNKARSSGLFSEGSLVDYAKVGNQYQPGRYASVAEAGPVGLAAKELSYKFGEALDWTGLPKVTSDALGYVFPKLGGTEQGGRQAGEAVATAGASMGIGYGVGSAIGAGIGLLGGPAAPGTVPAGQQIGGAIGAGVTAFLFGLDAYEKSDSLKEAAFAAAVPTIAGKFAALGTKSALSVLPKIPGASKIGLTGFTKAPGTITKTMADGSEMLVDVTSRGLTGMANKAAAFLGAEAGVTGGFAGIDLLRGEDLTNPDYWLGELAMSSVFSAKDLKHIFTPGTSNYDTIESTPYVKPTPPEPITPNSIKLASISDALSKSRTAREKALVIMDSTLDIAMKDKQILAKRMAEVDFKTKKSTVTAEAAGMVANESSVAPKEFENTAAAWDALSNRALKAPKGEKGKAIRDVFTQFKAKLKADRKDSLYAALEFRENNLAKLRKDRVKAEEEISIPEAAKIGQLIGHGDKELKLFSLNRGTFLSTNKGARRLDDYKKILRQRSWTTPEIKALHKAHVIEGWVRDKNSVSEANFKLYFNPDGTLKKPKRNEKKVPKSVTPEQIDLGQPTAKVPSTPVNKVDLTGNQTFAADLEPDLRQVEETVEPLAEAVEVQNDAANITPEGKAAVDQEAAEIAASAKAPVSKVPVAQVDKLTARLDRIKALRGQADEFKAKASDALNKKDPNGPTLSTGGMERAPAEIAKIMEYLYYKVREGVARVQLKLALRKLYKDMDEAEADLYLDAVEAEVKDEVELEENDANPVVPVKVEKLWEDISQEWNYGSLLDNAAIFRERIKVLYRAATTKQMKNRIAEYSQALEAGIAYKTDTYNVLSSMSVQRANEIFQAKRKSGDDVDEFLDRIRVLTNTMLRVGKKKAGRPKGVGDEVLPSQYALSLEARDIRKRMRAFDVQKADIEKQLENHKAALTNNPNVNVDFIPQVKEVAQDVKPEERALVYAMDALQEFMTYKGHKALQDMQQGKAFDAKIRDQIGGKDMQLGPKKNFGQYEPAPERSLMISLMEVVKNYTERSGEMETDKAGERAPKAKISDVYRQARQNTEALLPVGIVKSSKEYKKLFREIYVKELEKLEKGSSENIPEDRAANLLDTVANTSPEQLKTAIENDLFREFNKTVGRFYMPPRDGKSFGSEYYYDVETGLSKQTSIEKEFFLSDWDNKADEVLGDSEDMAEYKEKTGTQDDDRGELLGLFEGFDEIDSTRFSEQEKIDNLVSQNPSKASVEFVNTPLQVIKKLVLDRKSKESPHETLKSFIADALFDANGKRKPEGKIDKFFLQFLKPKVSEGSLPEIDADKVRQLYQATSKIIIDDMLASRANKIHLTKDQILKVREGFKGEKFTMLDKYLNKIAEHPAFAENISQIKQAFISNDLANPNRLGTEHLTNLYRFVSAKPPAPTERSRKWMSVKTANSNSKTIVGVVEETINRRKGYGQVVNSDTLINHVIEQFERGAIVDGQEVKLSDALREDIRIETLNFLYLRPDFEPGVVIRSGFNGDTVDSLPKGQLREVEQITDANDPGIAEGSAPSLLERVLSKAYDKKPNSLGAEKTLESYSQTRDELIKRGKSLRSGAGTAERLEEQRIAADFASRGAEHTDTDFLLYRPRVGQAGRETAPPRTTSSEASTFLKRFFFGAESVYGSTPEHKALVNKFQDEGLEVITDPLHEPGDGWIGENDLKAVTDAAQGDRRVIYFAKPEEKAYLESIGLTVKPYGSDLIAHTRELSIQDALVREVDRWAEQLRGEGVEESIIQELRPTYEQLARLNNSHNKIVFGDMNKGEGSGRTLLSGKTQYIFTQIPKTWHKMSKAEKATASVFVLGHEMRHRMEKLYKEGRLGEEGTKAYEEAHAWVKQQRPEHLRDMLDIMTQLNLPKDFRNNPAIAKVLETQGRDPEEFVTNFNTIMDFGFVEHNVTDFSDSMRLLPPQLRKVWQFMMKHLQNFTRSFSTVFKGQAKKDMKFLTEKLSQLRNAANKAEEDLNDLQFFADLRSDRMASAMQERFEELKVDTDPRWEKVYRGAEKINFDDSNTSAGAKTWRTEVRNKFRSFIDRGEVMALFNPKAARAMKVLFNSGIQSTTKTSRILAELYGSKADRTADGRVTKGDKVFRAYQDDSVIRVTGDLTRNLKNQPENLSKAMFELQPDGKYRQNEALLKEDKKLWDRYQRMSTEQKGTFWEMEMRIFNATKMMQSEILDSISLDHRADLQKMIGIQLPDKHRLAEEMSNKLYGAMEKMEDPMKSVDGYREFQEAEQMFDNKDAFNKAVRVAQELRGTLKEVKQFYAERPNYESLQRYTDYLVKMKKDGEESYTIQSNDKKAFIVAMQKAQNEGWDAGPVIKKGDKDSLVQLDNGLTQILTQHQSKIQAMLDRGDFGAVGTDSHKDAEEFFAANSVVDQVTRYQAAKNVYLPGTRRKLDKGYEELDRLGQMFHYVTRVNNAQMKQVSKKQFQHEINSAELKNDRDLREDLKQRAENFFSPDSELGSFITKWVAVHHLGFNFPSHVVELTQPYTMGISNLTAKYGTTWYQGFKTMNKAQKLAARFMTEFSKAKKARRDKDFKIEDFVKTGDKQLDDLLIRAINNHELRLNSLDTVEEQKRIASDHAALANGEKPQGKVSSVMNAYADFSLGLYGVFTRHNNIVGTIAGYMAAKEHGKVKDAKGNSRNLTHDEAVAEAEAFNRGTMLTGGRAGRQATPFQNKTVGQTVMSLGTYSTGWLSTLGYHMDIAFSKSRFPDATAQERKNHKKAFVSMLGSSFAFSGLMGMPFVGAMMKIASDLLDEDLEAEGIAFLDDLIGEPAIIESIMSGAANSFLDGAGIPIDLSSKMGIGGVFGFNPVTGYDATSLLGPTASMVKNFYNAGGALVEGDVLGALKTGGPTWTKKIAEMVQNEGEFKSSDGRPLFDNNGQQDAISKTLYGLGFGNQDVKRAKLANRLEASVEHYANNKHTKDITKIAGLVEKDSWVAQQEIIKLVEAELADNETYKRLDPVKQQIEYNKAFRQIVNSVAEKAVALQLPIDPRAEASKRSAKTMTKVISGLGVEMPDSSQMLRMSLKDAVYQKMGIAPPERSRRTIQNNMMLDEMQTQNPGYALPQVRALAGVM